MAHLRLQLGAAMVVPFGAPQRMVGYPPNWRARALGAAALVDAALQSGEWARRGRALMPAGSLSAAPRRHAAWHGAGGAR